MEPSESKIDSLPVFNEEDIAILRAYFAINEKYYWTVNEELTRQLADHPLWGSVLSKQSPEHLLEESKRSLELQRAAIYDGKWDDYANHLMYQGIAYARMNVSYTDWYEILRLYKDLLIPHIRRDFRSSADEAITFLAGLTKFIDFAMHIIARAYFQEKNNKIKVNEERFRAIFENSSDHIFLVDKNSLIVMINKVANGRAEDVVGTSVLAFQSEKSIDMVARSIRRVFEKKIPASWVADHIVDGKKRYYASSISPIFTQEGKVDLAVVIARDISEQKMAEDEVNRLNVDLEKKVAERTAELNSIVKELEAFSYSVSHDLRTPLRAINGFTQILIEDFADNVSEGAVDAMHSIVGNVRRMGQLIDDLLEFSRLGKRSIRKTMLDMNELVASVLFEMNAPTSARQANFTVKELESVRADRSMMRQVMMNLISNALKYSMKKVESIIEIGCYHDENNVVYYVKDNGAGFDMKYYDKLFGVFQRLHRANEFDGTGVGLALVQRIVSKHAGKIWAESSVGEGATFYVALPCNE
ncbi:MAG TPA: ATP-binding protein [Chryseolinea sp.]|nr:ATP-binding protein [Chryseolinea sp.]